MTPLSRLPKVRSRPLMDAIRGMPCALRIATFLGQPCSHRDTVVGAHLRSGAKGMGSKESDLCVVAACHLCHDLYDGRDKRGLEIRASYPHAFHEQVQRAWAETLARLVEAGVVSVKGDAHG